MRSTKPVDMGSKLQINAMNESIDMSFHTSGSVVRNPQNREELLMRVLKNW